MFITYEKWQKVSIASHDHATIHWRGDGTLLIRSVDTKRSVRTTWDAIGTWNTTDGVVRFTEDSNATRMVGTQMTRDGWAVLGLSGDWLVSGAIMKLESDGYRTAPETLMGRTRNRNKSQKRINAQRFGKVLTCDVELMRHAIETARLKREGNL